MQQWLGTCSPGGRMETGGGANDLGSQPKLLFVLLGLLR